MATFKPNYNFLNCNASFFQHIHIQNTKLENSHWYLMLFEIELNLTFKRFCIRLKDPHAMAKGSRLNNFEEKLTGKLRRNLEEHICLHNTN